ncbi:glutamyl-tRNA reductase [Adhaeribacter aquaticus]|uniref:glutamyl-tRNA reductase n=1 Tax=Adhaeribacter aquaticus TaxID=299567 RepID=UPI0004295076|nr:glutamyl-tRNA reductase [Adhaeribacter aquaticus]
MQNQFKAITLSYKHAPIAIREAVALNEAACKNLLQNIQAFTQATDVLVLSTCNRTEIYYVAGQDYSAEIIKLIAIEKGFIATKHIKPFFRNITDTEEAIKHLFHVSLGLESQVVGDMQIMNQVKNVYQWSADAGLAGPFLHRLMHAIFYTNKRVVNETAFKDGAASVSYATVELVEELTKEIEAPRVLMIGVGDIGANVCRNFQKSSLNNIIIINRTFRKAADLAQESNAVAVPWEQVWEEIEKADVVISSVPGDAFFISREKIETMGRLEHNKFFIDLSMPRSIDNSIETIQGACVYNIDNIRNRATEALEKRIAAIPEVKNIADQSISDFLDWAQKLIISPAIQQFKNKLEQIRQQEIARHLKNINDQEKELVEVLTKNILQKIIKLPVLELKAACQRGESETLLEGLSTLFKLEPEAVMEKLK